MQALRKAYDKTEIYEEKIKDKMEELAKICRDNDIPFFLTCCIKNTDSDSVYKTQASSPETYGYSISKNHFEHHVNVMNGFTTMPESSRLGYDFKDLY